MCDHGQHPPLLWKESTLAHLLQWALSIRWAPPLALDGCLLRWQRTGAAPFFPYGARSKYLLQWIAQGWEGQLVSF